MADSPVFDWLSEALTEGTPLSKVEARGTVRLALKDAGLDPATLDQRQAQVVLRQLLPRELEVRGIEGGAAICEDLVGRVPSDSDAPSAESPEAVFTRLAN